MTTPASNEADKPAANTTTNSGNTQATGGSKAKTSTGSSVVGVSVRLLAKSWLCPVEDERGKITWFRYSQGDELEVSEETFELLSGPNAFKPAFERVGADT